MRAPIDTFDETRYIAARSATADTTMQTSCESSFHAPHREWSVGLLDGTQMERSIDRSFAPADSHPSLHMSAHSQFDQQENSQELHQHSAIWPKHSGSSAPRHWAPYMPRQIGAPAEAPTGGLMSVEECQRYGVPPGSKWADSDWADNEQAKGYTSPVVDSEVQRIDWDHLPALGNSNVISSGQPFSVEVNEGLQRQESVDNGASTDMGTRRISNSKLPWDGTNQHNVNNALLQALNSDIGQCRAMYDSFKELDVELRQVYRSHSPSNGHLPAGSQTPHRPRNLQSPSGSVENFNLGRSERFSMPFALSVRALNFVVSVFLCLCYQMGYTA